MFTHFLSHLMPHASQAIFYHTVTHTPLPHIQHLYPVHSVEAFQKAILHLSRHFQWLSLEEYVRRQALPLPEQKKLPKGLLLTFDDGLVEIVNHIAPFLSKHQIPAVAFVNPHFMDSPQLMFRYLASCLIQRGLEYPEFIKRVEWQHPIYWQAEILACRYADWPKLRAIAQQFEFSEAEYIQKHQPYASLQQLQGLYDMGWSIGAHSLDHPHFTDLQADEQFHQADASIRWVQNHFPSHISVFAFPFHDLGVPKSLFDRLHNAHHNLVSFGTSACKLDSVPHHFHRVDMEQPLLPASQVLVRAAVRYYLNSFLGKSKIHRNTWKSQ